MKNKTFKKILCWTSLVLLVLTFVGTLYHFFRGIYSSLFEDDIKTAQNRINAAYQFLMMLGSGLCLVGSFIFFYKMKDSFVPLKLQQKLGIANKETEEAQ